MKIINFALGHSRTFISVLFFLIIAGTYTYITIEKEVDFEKLYNEKTKS